MLVSSQESSSDPSGLRTRAQLLPPHCRHAWLPAVQGKRPGAPSPAPSGVSAHFASCQARSCHPTFPRGICPRLLGTPGGPCRHLGLCVCGAQGPAWDQGMPIQLPSPLAALNASKNETDHTSQSWMDKRSLEPERLQEESFLSGGSLISRTRCFGCKVQKQVMRKRLQPCCLNVNSGHRAVGQHEGFLACLQPSWAPCCGVKAPLRVHRHCSWKCRSRWGCCPILAASAAARLEPLGGGPASLEPWRWRQRSCSPAGHRHPALWGHLTWCPPCQARAGEERRQDFRAEPQSCSCEGSAQRFQREGRHT